MSAYQSARSSSSSGSLAEHEPVIRSACMAFEEAIASRLAESYAAAETFTSEHGEVVTASIDLTAGIMLAIAKLGENIGTSPQSVEEFVASVADVLLSDHSMKIALYDPNAEIAKVFENQEDPSMRQMKQDLLKQMHKNDTAAEEERNLKEAKDLVKKLEAEYQAKVEDLVNIAKFGHTLRKKDESDKITEADVADFRKKLGNIFEEQHAKKLVLPMGPQQTMNVTSWRSSFFAASADKDGPQSPDRNMKRTQSAADDDSTGSNSPRISCCAALFRRRQSRRRPVF